MSQLLTPKAPPEDSYSRNGRLIIIALIVAALPTAVLFAYLGFANNLQKLFVIPATLALSVLIDLWLLKLVRVGKSTLAAALVGAVFLINVLIAPFFVQGLGAVAAVAVIIVTLSIAWLAMPSKYSLIAIFAGIFSALAAFILDSALSGDRVRLPELEAYAPYIVALIAVLIFMIALREFNKLNLRVKIVLGVLVTSVVVVSALTLFGWNRANFVANSLASKFEKNAASQIETKMATTVQAEANKTDAVFADALRDLIVLADYRASLQKQNTVFSGGLYWDAKTRLVQLPAGQYGNAATDTASIFIPSTIVVDDATLNDLNVSVYLDFYAPHFLKSHPNAAAVYYISKTGANVYYPNINLAQNVPADFDSTKQPFYTSATPENNPQRKPRWTDVYQDHAGEGLIVTLSIPVYANDVFLGVMGLDLQIGKIAQGVANVQVGDGSYAFIVDQAGHILTMPEQGYSLYEITPEQTSAGLSPKLSVLAKGTPSLQEATAKMVNGETGVATVTLNNSNFYVAFTPLATPNYRLAVVAPANFTGQLTLENEIAQTIQSALQGLPIVLVLLFCGALVVGLWISQRTTQPLLHITEVVESRAAGDLFARVDIETQDEIGALASAFNSMADKLNLALLDAEGRVKERTSELEEANEKNVRRAAQFEAIARVAHTVSSSQTLEALLPQITEAISEQFGFYHIGVFLLDSRREYAVLVAANSAGGKKMLERNHRLRASETSIVGFATSVGQPRIALNVGLDAIHFNNPDLSETRSEIALPLRIGADIFGALDAQSKEENAFSQDDVNILSILADQVSVAIQNARSYQQTRDALVQAEAASLQLSGVQWKQFLSRQTVGGFNFDGVDVKKLTSADKSRPRSLSIPLTLRGARIGSINFNAPNNPNREWTNDEIAIAQAAAERASLALESARLLQEAQKRASKERAIGEASAKIGSLVNLESILQTAIQELGATLPGTDIAIQFTDTTFQK